MQMGSEMTVTVGSVESVLREEESIVGSIGADFFFFLG